MLCTCTVSPKSDARGVFGGKIGAAQCRLKITPKIVGNSRGGRDFGCANGTYACRLCTWRGNCQPPNIASIVGGGSRTCLGTCRRVPGQLPKATGIY